MDKRPAIIKKMFDRIAPTYDVVNTIMSFSMDRILRNALIRKLHPEKNDIVLDVATGTGAMAVNVLDKGAKVIGVDISGKMLKTAMQRKAGFKNGINYHLVNADALKMPFADGTYNKAMISFGIRNMESVPAFFAEIYRVLDAGGVVAALEFSVPQNAFVRFFYKMYLGFAIPLIGGIISGDRAAYNYLRDSVMGFSSPEEIEKIIRDNGFESVETKKLIFGIACLYSGAKP